jgi:hypothetical protein
MSEAANQIFKKAKERVYKLVPIVSAGNSSSSSSSSGGGTGRKGSSAAAIKNSAKSGIGKLLFPIFPSHLFEACRSTTL